MPTFITGKGTDSLRRHSPSDQKVLALLSAARTAQGHGVAHPAALPMVVLSLPLNKQAHRLLGQAREACKRSHNSRALNRLWVALGRVVGTGTLWLQ